MSVPVIQAERASPMAKRTLPTASDAAPTMNRRSQVSAAGEKIWPILGPDNQGRPSFQPELCHKVPIFSTRWNFGGCGPFESRGISLRTEFATMDGSSDESPRPNAFERSDADPRLLSALAIGVAIFLLAAPFLIVAGYPDAS